MHVANIFPYIFPYFICFFNNVSFLWYDVASNTVWRETLVVGKFCELSAKLPLVK